MPSHEEHCQHSLKRYGKTFSELHRWMDEPSTLLGPSHRKYRHDPNTTPQVARTLFGPLADQACLDHIRLDHLEGKGKKPGRVSQLDGIMLGFMSLITFIIGLVFVSVPRVGFFGWLFALIMWFNSFILFIGFIGSLSKTKNMHTCVKEALEENVPALQVTTSICPQCQRGVAEEAKFCPYCGNQL